MNRQYWLGTEDSFKVYEKALQLAQAKQQAWEAKAADGDEPDFPPLYERVGDVGVIRIQGSLIPGEAGWLRYCGVTGYADIKAAALEGVADKGAKSLMIFSESGGGSVAGVEDAGEFLAKVAQVKPMSAYSEFSASAAYWLTSEATHITTAPTGINGSLGVIRVHTEETKALENEGITVTVMRAGRYKALANPYERLTDEAKAEIQSKLDDLYGTFISTVARNRGTSELVADQVMGQGREFLGKRGVEAGLVDSIGNFDDALAYARSNRKLGGRKATNFGVSATAAVAQASVLADNAATSNPTGTKMKLNAEQLAAIAAGATVEQVTAQAMASTADNKPEVEAQAETETTTSEAEAEEAETETVEAKSDSEVVTFLKTELAAAQLKASSATFEAQTLAGKVSALEADLSAVMAVVQTSVKNLHISVGKQADATKLSATELVAEHSAAQAAIMNKFKTGGVAASTASTESKPKAALFAPRDVAAAKNMFNPR